VVGVITERDGLKLFQINSPLLQAYEHDRWVDVGWEQTDPPRRHRAKIVVTCLNAPGSLAQVAQVIGDADGNIDTLGMLSRAADFTQMEIGLEVWDVAHLTEILRQLRLKPSVAKAERVFA
jgi:(p)ppGpp synthase/HD superfamily hydrolase